MEHPTPVKPATPKPFYKTYLKGEFFFGVWNVVSRGVGFFNTLIVLSKLTVYQYGVFQLILSSFSGIAVFMGLGGETMRNDILRYVGERDIPRAKRLFYESTAVRVTIGIILWAVIFFGASFFFSKYSADFIFYIRIMSFLFLHDAVLPSLRLALEAEKKFSLIASRSSISRFIQLAIIAWFYFFAAVGLREVILSLVVASYISIIFMAVPVFRSYVKVWRQYPVAPDMMIGKLLLSYGKWELLRPVAGKFVDFIQVWMTKFLISTEAVAIFSVAQTMIGTLANFMPVNTLSVLIPLHISEKQKLQKIYNTGTKYLILFSLAVGVGGLIAAQPFIYWFFPKYIASLPYFDVLLLTLPITAASAVAGVFLVVYRRQGFLLFQKLMKGLLSILLYALLIPAFGLWGLVAQAIILSIVLFVIIYVYMVRSKLDVSLNWSYLTSYDDIDKEFLRNFFSDAKRVLGRFMPKRSAENI
jgi:O-antigen/teichoic acid export membrane protein